MIAASPSVKILALKLIIFMVVAAGLFSLADFYARTRNIDAIASGMPLNSASSSEESVLETVKVIKQASSSEPTSNNQSLRAPILMYHYVSVPSATTTLPGLYLDPAIFENQLQKIIEGGYQAVFMSGLAADIRNGSAAASSMVALTFDDGYEDFYTNAYPLLKKYNLKSTLYVIVNAVDKPGYITKEQLKEMAASGYVEIGSHTFNHPDLRLKDRDDAYYEIKGSKDALEDILKQPILTFAYPYGYYNSQTLEIMEQSGYLGAVSVIPGVKHEPDNSWLITRLRPGSRSGEEFVGLLEGSSSRVRASITK